MKNIPLIAVLAVIAVAGTYFAFNAKPAENNQPVGSASSPSVNGNCMEVNGVTQCFYATRMANASTTCSFKSPNATTTLISAAAQFSNTYGGSFDVGWGKAANAFSTTTSLGYKSAAIASGDTGTFVATSSGATIEEPTGVIAPNTFLNFKIGSSSPTLSGSCGAILQII